LVKIKQGGMLPVAMMEPDAYFVDVATAP
jgi:hypothetical protein